MTDTAPLKTFTHRAHFVTFSTSRRGDWSEIGVYVDEVLPGAGKILVAVITHPCRGAKWILHSAQGHSLQRLRTKAAARKAAFEMAVASDAGRIHAKRLGWD